MASFLKIKADILTWVKPDITTLLLQLLFQSTSWKSGKSEKAKAGFGVYQVRCGESKLDRMLKNLERAKAKF